MKRDRSVRRYMPVLIAIASLFILFTGMGFTDVIYVDKNATGTPVDGTTWDNAFRTIQAGVNSATYDDQVWVADGTYTENVTMGNGIILYGGFLGAEQGGYEDELSDRDYVANETIINGGASGTCVTMAWCAIVDGFTVTNGSATNGGGFYCSGIGTGDHAIRNCIIDDNAASGNGGGIYTFWSAVEISGNEITNNTANYGAGIYGRYDTMLIIDNFVALNIASSEGGGMDIASGNAAEISGNIITNNEAAYAAGGLRCALGVTATNNVIAENTVTGASAKGGGVSCHAWSTYSPVLTNNTIADNSVANTSGNRGGGVICYLWQDAGAPPAIIMANNIVATNTATTDAGIHLETGYNLGGTITLSYNDVWDNGPGDDYTSGLSHPSDISDDPEFEGSGDYHLTLGSPCIDAGDNGATGIPDTDFEGDPRIMDGDLDETETVDIGADEARPVLTAYARADEMVSEKKPDYRYGLEYQNLDDVNLYMGGLIAGYNSEGEEEKKLRFYLSFDISDIGDNDTIKSVSLSLYNTRVLTENGAEWDSVSNTTLYVYHCDPASEWEPTAADFEENIKWDYVPGLCTEDNCSGNHIAINAGETLDAETWIDFQDDDDQEGWFAQAVAHTTRTEGNRYFTVMIELSDPTTTCAYFADKDWDAQKTAKLTVTYTTP